MLSIQALVLDFICKCGWKKTTKHLHIEFIVTSHNSAYTDRNLVRSLLEFSTKAAFPSTTLESLVLDLEVKRSQIFEQAST